MASHEQRNAGDLDEREFAEELAPLIPAVPPIAGRMLGLLLVTNESQLSSRDLMDQLSISSASVSNMGRLLVHGGLVVRSVSPETRRDLFTLRSDAWLSQWSDFVGVAQRALDLLEDALARRPSDQSVSRKKLEETRDHYAFLVQDLPLQQERFRKWRAEQRGEQPPDA